MNPNAILEFVPIPIWIKNTNDELLFINAAFSNHFHVASSDIINVPMEQLLIQNKGEEIFELLLNIQQIKSSCTNLYHTTNGTILVVSSSYTDPATSHPLILGATIPLTGNPDELAQHSLLKTIINNVTEIIFYKNLEGRYVDANKACFDFYALSGVYDFIGKTDAELGLEPSFAQKCIEHDNKVLQSKKTTTFEEQFAIPTGESIIFETTKTPVLNKAGEVCGIVGVVRDITKQRTLEDHLRYLSYTDTLSGLYNRTFFNETLCSLYKEDVFPLGFILADVNGLKIINDTLGHLVGDELIQSTAQLLKDTCPPNARIFRWGGDEFVVLLPNSTQEECNRLILQITNTAEGYTNKNFKLSLSLGSSLINNNEVDINKVMQDAEEKLYRQKMLNFKSLRNSVLSTLQNSLAAKNVETQAHTQRLVDNCLAIGRAMQLDLAVLDELVLVAKLHDIGKIGIPESILLKPSKLTEEEFEIMKTHTEKGYRLTCSFPELSHISRAILTHHERWDGKGYPLGIKGEEIPLTARIVAVVDAFDAMTYNRNYNRIKTKEQALAEIKRCAGSQFDPEIVNVFCQL